ncbi:GNAT family N-acetyltransferase [Glycomyces sp. TRM65418]|uniref:GNAT family N-acetyltransferase n=1 Tax=Glycomyces sp. TRM65418 TaxID=2867006 RepID=UPI001CE68C06|nr:GNAT family N-acetyltransferase [Glycomyces sp. TRM65418]MCC3764272.1 GNAT family N-acetyltransferase [Glycomyces sp. TRM65418]QZD53956.1 GNAT family N-acetyltransferase [Glycomyces sp. TRM65418]
MEIIELDPADGDLVSGAFDVMRATHAADHPENPAPHRNTFVKGLAYPPPDEDEAHYVAVEDGKVLAVMGIGLPNRANLHFAWAWINVHPDHRRRGIGTALVERFFAYAREHGRTELTLDTHMTWEGGVERDKAGQLFLERHGFKLALTCINRRCAVDALDPAVEQELLEQAQAAAGDDYEIISWIGRTPEELIETMARIDSTILAEVPLGDLELEPETIDADLKRAKAERGEAIGIVPIQTVARHRESGEVVANTAVFAHADDPGYTDAYQGITIVDPAHRGHRLGLLLKLVNLRLVRERYPHLRAIWTDNADVNAPMIGINVTLGYEIVDAVGEFQIKLDS